MKRNVFPWLLLEVRKQHASSSWWRWLWEKLHYWCEHRASGNSTWTEEDLEECRGEKRDSFPLRFSSPNSISANFLIGRLLKVTLSLEAWSECCCPILRTQGTLELWSRPAHDKAVLPCHSWRLSLSTSSTTYQLWPQARHLLSLGLLEPLGNGVVMSSSQGTALRWKFVKALSIEFVSFLTRAK